MSFFIGKVTHGRPDCTGRDEREIAVYDMLDSLGVEYEHIDHEEASTNALCEDIEKVLGVHICKNLFLCDRKKTRFFMLSMRGDKQFVTREFSRSIGAPRLSFAPAEKMLELLGVTPGSVSVMGLMNDKDNEISYYIDENLLKDKYFGCHPCKNTSSLKIKTADILEKVLPRVSHSHSAVSTDWEENE